MPANPRASFGRRRETVGDGAIATLTGTMAQFSETSRAVGGHGAKYCEAGA